MDQLNARINIRPDALQFPLSTVHTRLGMSAVLRLYGVPDDVTGVFVRIFKRDGAHFDIPTNLHTDGTRCAYVIGTCFPDTGATYYEVHATDARGNATSLGRGMVWTRPHSVTGTPIAPGEAVQVAQIPAKSGGMVNVYMVQDEFGSWVYEAETVEGES